VCPGLVPGRCEAWCECEHFGCRAEDLSYELPVGTVEITDHDLVHAYIDDLEDWCIASGQCLVIDRANDPRLNSYLLELIEEVPGVYLVRLGSPWENDVDLVGDPWEPPHTTTDDEEK